MFIVNGDGKYSFRIYDADRTSTRTIYSYEWLDEPQIKTNASEFLSSCKVGYYRDYDNDKYRTYRNADYEDEVLARYKAYQEKTFDTVLVNENDAIEKSETIILSKSTICL